MYFYYDSLYDVLCQEMSCFFWESIVQMKYCFVGSIDNKPFSKLFEGFLQNFRLDKSFYETKNTERYRPVPSDAKLLFFVTLFMYAADPTSGISS